MDRVYLDTSFFIGLLENQHNRRAEAKRILEFEIPNDRFTSQLTINEFLIGIYDGFKDEPDCAERIEAVEAQIRSIARVVAIDDDVTRKAALIQSVYGEIHKHAKPKEPRDRGFRWDALHLATADNWRCHRIYAWDGKWEKLPPKIKEMLFGSVIAPAVCPGLPFGTESEESSVEEEEASAAVESLAEESPTPLPASSTEPPPPSEQSLSAAPATASQPAPSPLSGPPADQEQQRQPEADLPAPAPPPPAAEPQSL